MTRPGDQLATIVANGLCIGCGACAGMAPDELEMHTTPEGRERPRSKAPMGPDGAALLEAVCPGVRVIAPDRRALPAEPVFDSLWGHAYRMDRGFAADADVRFRGASGGALSALSIYLLQTGRVESVLHVAASQDDPLHSGPQLSFDATQVMAGSGSRYGPAAPLSDFRSLLDRGRPFAFVGKPCDVTAVRNIARVDPRVDELVPYLLTLFCGGVPALARSQAFVRESGVELDELRRIRYRGHGNPGPTRMETVDGRVVDRSYREFWGPEEGGWQLQFRCKICPDSIGEEADVAVFDTWPGGEPTGEDEGYNGFIARTPRGLELIESAERDGAIRLVAPYRFRDLDSFHPHHADKRRGLAPRLLALRLHTGVRLRFRGHRLLRLALAAGPVSWMRNFAGMRRRLRAGGHLEPPPR